MGTPRRRLRRRWPSRRRLRRGVICLGRPRRLPRSLSHGVRPLSGCGRQNGDACLSFAACTRMRTTQWLVPMPPLLLRWMRWPTRWCRTHPPSRAHRLCHAPARAAAHRPLREWASGLFGSGMIAVGSRGAVCAWLRPTLARPDSHHNASLDAQTLRGVVGGVREATKGSGGGPQQSGPPDHARRVGRAPPNRMGGIPAQAPSFAVCCAAASPRRLSALHWDWPPFAQDELQCPSYGCFSSGLGYVRAKVGARRRVARPKAGPAQAQTRTRNTQYQYHCH